MNYAWAFAAIALASSSTPYRAFNEPKTFAMFKRVCNPLATVFAMAAAVALVWELIT